jgi:uncharacterized protein
MAVVALEKNILIGWLLDFYGDLLTEKQARVLVMHWNDDLSLAEIGQELAMSRQAVHDALARGESRLRVLEEKMGLLSRHMRVGAGLERCREMARRAGAGQPSAELAELDEALAAAIAIWEE